MVGPRRDYFNRLPSFGNRTIMRLLLTAVVLPLFLGVTAALQHFRGQGRGLSQISLTASAHGNPKGERFGPSASNKLDSVKKQESPLLKPELFYNNPVKPPLWLSNPKLQKPGVPQTPPPP